MAFYRVNLELQIYLKLFITQALDEGYPIDFLQNFRKHLIEFLIEN